MSCVKILQKFFCLPQKKLTAKRFEATNELVNNNRVFIITCVKKVLVIAVFRRIILPKNLYQIFLKVSLFLHSADTNVEHITVNPCAFHELAYLLFIKHTHPKVFLERLRPAHMHDWWTLGDETIAGQTGTLRPQRSSQTGWAEVHARRCTRSRSGSGETRWRTCPGTSGRTWPAPTGPGPRACGAAEPSERNLAAVVKADMWRTNHIYEWGRATLYSFHEPLKRDTRVA